MGFRMGIVGLPNVGKSTLFNALTRTAAAQAANFPFCTIEPNVGEVAVPDARLERLAEIAGSRQVIPTRMTFVDIAGLVKGASKGEGLGNQFLHNIREVDAIAHVLRCFEDGDVTHVEGRVDPVADAETIETELMLADLESIEKRLANLSRKIRGGDKEAVQQERLLKAAQAALEAGRPARTVEVEAEDARAWRNLQLLTTKPVLYVCNVGEEDAATGNRWSDKVARMAAAEGNAHVIISARIEEEISQLDPDEAQMFLEEMGLKEAGLDRLIRAGYELLQLETFFTVGPKEARAWTIRKGTLAPQAAGVIHGDFEKRLANLSRKIRGGDKEAVQQERLLKAAQAALEAGRPARTVEVEAEDARAWRNLQLLTTKPVLYVCNVGEEDAATGNRWSDKVARMAAAEGNAHVIISARIEEEISQLDPDEAQMFLEEMGLKEAGLDRLIRAGYELLQLETFFTVGPKEARAWTIRKGTLAPQAAGVIHGDFEKGFIRAETISYEDFVTFGGEQGAKEAGRMRSEGKSYVVQDGDVMHFLFNT